MAQQPLRSSKQSSAMLPLARQIFRGLFPSWCRRVPRRRLWCYCPDTSRLAQPPRPPSRFRFRRERFHAPESSGERRYDFVLDTKSYRRFILMSTPTHGGLRFTYQVRGTNLFRQESLKHLASIFSLQPGFHQTSTVEVGEDVPFAERIAQELQIFLGVLFRHKSILHKVLLHFISFITNSVWCPG